MPTPALDAIDLKILAALQGDARISNVDLARKVHLSPSPCLARVRALEEGGLVARYVTLLDPKKLGLTVSVLVQVTLERQVEKALDVFEGAVLERPEVMECYLMTGDADYLLRVVVPDIRAYDSVYKRLTQAVALSDVSSSFAMEEIKFTTALPLNYAQ